MTGQRDSIREDSSRAVLTALTAGHHARVGRKWPQYLAAVIVNLSSLSVGTVFSWTSSASAPLREVGITQDQFSWIGATMAIGGFVGALPAGALADRLGRRLALLALGVPLLLAWFLLAFGSPSVGLLVAGRFFGGVGSGAVTVIVPMYISEIAHSTVRGTCSTFMQLQIVAGIVLGQLVGLTGSLLALGLVCGVVPLLYVVAFYSMPESPVYLVSKGQLEKARRTIVWLRGDKCDVDYEISRMTIQVQESREMKRKVSDLIATSASRRAFLVSMGLMAVQQLSGVNAVIFYTSDIFQTSGSRLPAELATIVVGVVQLVSSYASTLLVDKAGRRPLLILSSLVMSICLAILAVYFHLQLLKHDLSAVAWLPLAALALFIIAFSLGMGPLPWVVMGEIFSEKTKATASAVASSTNWMLAFIITKSFQTLNAAFTPGGTFGLFSLVCAMGTIFIAFLVPETKGKDLLQIQAMLEGKENLDADSDDDEEEVKLSRRQDIGAIDIDGEPDSERTVVRRMSGLRDSENDDEPTRVVFTM